MRHPSHAGRIAVASLAAAFAAACAGAPSPATTTPPATAPAAPPAAVPADSPRTSAPLDRTTRPGLGPPPVVTLPPSSERTLPNGLRVVVVEQHELPLADFVLVVGSGAEADPAGRAGLATLTADLMDEGTTTRDALQIADQAAYLGVSVGARAGWDVSSVSLHAPTAQLDSALALFADVALRPSFPAKEFARLQKERLTGLLQLRDRAPAIADRAFARYLFGDANPYGRSVSGTEGTTRALARADVQRFYQTHFRPNNATLLVVGDVKPDDVVARVERVFGGWQRADVARTTVPPAAATTTPTVYLVDKPGAPQSSVRIGLVGVPRATPDYFPLIVMNTILGGSFTSRLNNNLREVKGFTYGAGSGFDMRRAAGPFVARAEVTGTKTDSSLVEFMKELRAIADTVPADELTKAKRYLQLQLPGDFETTGDIAGQLMPLVVYGLPLDWHASYVQRIEQVTQADVQRAAKQYLDPSKFVVVIVGDRKSIEPGVRALNLGKVEVRSVVDVLGTSAAESARTGAGAR